MSNSKYPLHNLMRSMTTERNTAQDLLDWLAEHGYWICEKDEYDRFYPTMDKSEKIIADFFDIDLNAWHAEKDAMLAEIRGEA